MTSSQILAKAQKINARIQLRDVWRLLGEFDQQGLVFCVNPQHVTGKVYFLTNLGRAVVKAAFGKDVSAFPADMNWDAYAHLARGKVRRLVALEIANPCADGQEGKTTTEVRKKLMSDNPIGLNQTIRAIRELQQQNLIQNAGTPTGRARKRYQLTPLGRRVVEELKRSPDSGKPNESDAEGDTASQPSTCKDASANREDSARPH